MFDLETVKAALHEVVEEKGPDFVYEGDNGCTYAVPESDGTFKPSCIVGQIIYKLDKDAFDKVVDNEWSTSYLDGPKVLRYDGASEISRKFKLFTMEATTYLCEAQEEQDQGTEYGIVEHKLNEEFGE